jgi:excisionase family DNA binding protein
MPRANRDLLKFTDTELATAFSDPESSRRFPYFLTVRQAAELLQIPVATIHDWSSRGLLRGCSKKIGKHLRIVRDRFIQQAFNNFNQPQGD